MHTHAHTHTHTCTCTRMHTCTCIRTHMHTHTRTHTCTCTCTHTHTHTRHTHTHTSVSVLQAESMRATCSSEWATNSRTVSMWFSVTNITSSPRLHRRTWKRSNQHCQGSSFTSELFLSKLFLKPILNPSLRLLSLSSEILLRVFEPQCH